MTIAGNFHLPHIALAKHAGCRRAMTGCQDGKHGVASYSVIAKSYDRLHDRFLKYAGSGGQSAFEGAVLALVNPGMSVLDAACGTGRFGASLIRKSGGISLTLLDGCPEMLRQTPALPAEKILGQLEHLPFEDGSFDLVSCAWGIETTVHPIETMRELLRVVRLNGHLCFVACADVPASSVGGWIMKQAVSIRGTGKFLDPSVLAAMAAEPGVAFARRIPCRGPAIAMVIRKAPEEFSRP